MMKRSERIRQALQENANVVGMAGFAALSLLMLNPLPFLVGMVAETIYLVVVPDSQWYMNRLGRRFDADVKKRRASLKAELLPSLAVDKQDAFRRLEAKREQIEKHAPDDQPAFETVLRKLDYLLEEYLRFAHKEREFCNYLASLANETQSAVTVSSYQNAGQWRLESLIAALKSHYNQEITNLSVQIQTRTESKTRAIQEQRLSVLQRRLELLDRTYLIVIDLREQMKLLEETFDLINHEIRARNSDAILADLEEVVLTTTSTTKAVQELGEYMAVR